MKLSDFELDVMQRFWEKGESLSTDVIDELSVKKGVTASTVRTIIFRLEDKGALKRVGQERKTLIYKPVISQEAMSSRLLPEFMRRLFSNNRSKLISTVLAEGKLSKQEIKELKKVIDELDKGK